MLHFERSQYTEHKSASELKPYDFETPANAGRSWAGIKHFDLVDAIVKQLKSMFGVVPAEQTYAVSNDHTDMLGTITLGQVPKGKRKPVPLFVEGVPHDTHQTIGFRHDNAMKRSLQVCFGGSVCVCTNGMVVGSDTWKRKHTTGLNLMDWIGDCLKGMWDRMKEMSKRVSDLGSYMVSPEMHDSLLLMLARSKAFNRRGQLSWKYAGLVDEEWNTARQSDEHPFNGGTLWDWYNCATEIIKTIPTPVQFHALEQAYQACRAFLPDSLRNNEWTNYNRMVNSDRTDPRLIEGTVVEPTE